MIRNPRAWVWRVGFRVATKELRAAGALIPEGIYELDEEAAEVTESLSRLSERQRAVIVLHYYADLPTDEIAELLGMNRSTVPTSTPRPSNSPSDSLTAMTHPLPLLHGEEHEPPPELPPTPLTLFPVRDISPADILPVRPYRGTRNPSAPLLPSTDPALERLHPPRPPPDPSPPHSRCGPASALDLHVAGPLNRRPRPLAPRAPVRSAWSAFVPRHHPTRPPRTPSPRKSTPSLPQRENVGPLLSSKPLPPSPHPPQAPPSARPYLSLPLHLQDRVRLAPIIDDLHPPRSILQIRALDTGPLPRVRPDPTCSPPSATLPSATDAAVESVKLGTLPAMCPPPPRLVPVSQGSENVPYPSFSPTDIALASPSLRRDSIRLSLPTSLISPSATTPNETAAPRPTAAPSTRTPHDAEIASSHLRTAPSPPVTPRPLHGRRMAPSPGSPCSMASPGSSPMRQPTERTYYRDTDACPAPQARSPRPPPG